MEVVRSSLRNQFDRSLVSNFTYQEQLLDYGFSHLGLHRQSSVKHPVVMTEPVCNPNYCRWEDILRHYGMSSLSLSPSPLVSVSQLLFEADNLTAVGFGVDALC